MKRKPPTIFHARFLLCGGKHDMSDDKRHDDDSSDVALGTGNHFLRMGVSKKQEKETKYGVS
jgi:hypothetical protein